MNNTIYLYNTNPRPPRKGAVSNTYDLFFLLGDEPFRVIGGRTYCMPTGVKMFTNPKLPNYGDTIVAPRSSSSLLVKNNERSDLVFLPNGTTYEVKSYKNISLRITNTIGYIDWEYQNDIQVRFTIDGLEEGEEFMLDPTKPDVQIFPKDAESRLVVVESLSEIPDEFRKSTQRGERGFGHTDM